MKFDTWLLKHTLKEMPALTRAIEAIGFAGLWTAEAGSDAFLPLVLAAEHSQQITLGTSSAGVGANCRRSFGNAMRAS